MEADALWQGFCDPPDEARPRAWWHWMDGNVDPEGIRLDLEWLQRVGVRGVQMFDGGMGTPLVVPDKVSPGSPEWREAVRLATSTARRLGLEFTVATSAGWSAAGGPWVEPVDAMKKVVWSETLVGGGRAVEVPLRPLPDVSGPYQDAPRGERRRFAQEWTRTRRRPGTTTRRPGPIHEPIPGARGAPARLGRRARARCRTPRPHRGPRPGGRRRPRPVRVNGTDCGVVWTAPWRVDVSGTLLAGRNRIEIDVANAWMNRLIAEAARPTGEIFPPVARVYAPDAPIRASGLLSRVLLQLFS